jgi:hypothetical protein
MTNEHPITPLPYPLRHCSPYQLRYCSLEQHPTPPPRPPMTDQFRAMCAELVEALHEHTCLYEGHESELVARARALLAQPVAKRPTVMEIIELHSWLEDEWRANNDGEDLPTVDFARAVLAKWGHQ